MAEYQSMNKVSIVIVLLSCIIDKATHPQRIHHVTNVLFFFLVKLKGMQMSANRIHIKLFRLESRRNAEDE